MSAYILLNKMCAVIIGCSGEFIFLSCQRTFVYAKFTLSWIVLFGELYLSSCQYTFVKHNVCSRYWLFRCIYIFYHVNVHLCMRNVRCHELSHSVNNIYHHVSIHFVKQNVCSFIGCSGEFIIFIMSTYICVCDMYVVI